MPIRKILVVDDSEDGTGVPDRPPPEERLCRQDR